jgi:hypothetical protein
MATVFVEARPKGRIDGSSITDYVVEDYANMLVGGSFRTVELQPLSVQEQTGISEPQGIAKALNGRGVSTPWCGRRWHGRPSC